MKKLLLAFLVVSCGTSPQIKEEPMMVINRVNDGSNYQDANGRCYCQFKANTGFTVGIWCPCNTQLGDSIKIQTQ